MTHPPRVETALTLFPDLPTPIAEGRGRIRPRTRILRTIGAELISSEVVAVTELVRNSYDADATKVDLHFEHPEDPDRATLEIRDNGHGMTREILLGPWLEPATDWKTGVHGESGSGERSPGGRRRLGSKGVGRFAAQRLGSHLEVRTRAEGHDTELLARFDWRELEHDEYLDQVRVPWREGPVDHVPAQGTHLCIEGLRDGWTPERFERLQLALSRLVSPTMHESFQITILVNGTPRPVLPAIDSRAAMYSISGSVDAGGTCTINYSDINGATERWQRTVAWRPEENQVCGPFTFRISAWDLDREPLKLFLEKTGSKLGLRDFRRAIRDHSGISLYRDGFRILPYGEPDNDWLRLDRRRVNNPTMRLSNNQILGTIQLTADDNPELRDQTNREGLVTGDAYSHLQEVALELLAYLETRRFAARRAMDIDWQRRASSLPALMAGQTENRVDTLLDGLTVEEVSTEHVDNLRNAFTELREGAADAVQHYASLAAVGQMSGLVFRQLRHPMRQIRSDLALVLDDLVSGIEDKDDLDDVRSSVIKALEQLDRVEDRMSKLDPLATGRRGRRLCMLQLNEVLADVVDAWMPEFDRAGVHIDFQGDCDVRAKANRDIIQQVLSSLLENACHFAPLGDTDAASIHIEVLANGFAISDSGPGIPVEMVDSIFEPHFTTRDEALGMGLTLSRDLLRSVGCRINVADPSTSRFVVVLDAR